MNASVVVYVGAFELPDRNAAALRVVANAKIMRDLGFRVILLGARQGSEPGLKRSSVDYEGFECWSIRSPKRLTERARYLSGAREVFSVLSTNLGSLSHVICYNYPAIAQLRILRFCRNRNIACIADTTEWYDSSGGGILFSLIKSADTWLRMRLVNPAMDGLITTSAWMSRQYQEVGLPIVELPSLFDKALLNEGEGFAGEGGVRRFIYVGTPFDVGRVNSRRSNLKDRLDLVVSIFFELHSEGREFEFDVYGISEGDYLDVFPEHAHYLDSMKLKVKFHGVIPNKQARELVAKYDFSIFFRDKTRVTLAGFPTKLAESISLGTPVISNMHENLERYSGEPGCLLAWPGEEREVVRSSLEMSVEDLGGVRKSCRESQTFHYATYLEHLKEFMRKIKKSKKDVGP